MNWKTIKSAYAFICPWLRVRKDHVQLPSGFEIDDFYVVESSDWVNVIAITEDGRFLIEEHYRYGIGQVCFELPAGVVSKGEVPLTAAKRELKEETGLDFHPYEVDEIYSKPYFTTIGMTDESCAAVYGTATGVISKDGLEETEDIEVILADRAEIRRILQDEHVSLMCAYMMMHFLHAEPGKAFDFLK